ncbi:MAG: zf-HC2 domain-containing protein [Candidatus Omnitrophica bacterium]|jgi:predicted anti-sigma-YlaC factor YlaD|nr:zf-HC2 domain-containing protein [Candidatus Omnitrophota bacterium]
MNCEEIKIIIPSYIKHTATDQDISKVEEHLCICDSCRQHLAQLMNKPSAIPMPQKETLPEIPMKKDTNILEYVMLGIGVVVLLFVVFLLIKG